MTTRDLLEIEVSAPAGRGLPLDLAEGLSSALGRIGIRCTSSRDGHGRLLVQLINVDDDECRYAIQIVRKAGYRIAVTVATPHEGRTGAQPGTSN